MGRTLQRPTLSAGVRDDVQWQPLRHALLSTLIARAVLPVAIEPLGMRLRHSQDWLQLRHSHGCRRPNNERKRMTMKILFATVAPIALLSTAQAAEQKKNPEQVCQAQALASIAREWPNVFQGHFEIMLKGNRCLIFLQAPAVFEGKRTAFLIDGKTGALLSEFYGPQNSDRGQCSYRGGKFPTSQCSWDEYLDKVNQM